MKNIAALSLFVLTLTACTPLVDQSADKEAQPGEESMMKDDDAMQGSIVNGYQYYEEGVLKNGEAKVLFFHASWCPDCKKADEDLRDWYAAEQIPLPTYRIDYDSATALKSRYGITTQHTFVLVDGSGNELSTVIGPGSVELKRLLYGNTEDATNAEEDNMEEMMHDEMEEDMGEAMDDDKEDNAMMDDDKEDNAMMDDDKEAMQMESSGRFTAYEDGVIANGEASVLFFHAEWCPYCKANEQRLHNWYGSQDIPRSVYKIDYDTASNLKQQFGVTQQDTFILIDGSGNEISRVSFPSEQDLRDLLG